MIFWNKKLIHIHLSFSILNIYTVHTSTNKNFISQKKQTSTRIHTTNCNKSTSYNIQINYNNNKILNYQPKYTNGLNLQLHTQSKGYKQTK